MKNTQAFGKLGFLIIDLRIICRIFLFLSRNQSICVAFCVQNVHKLSTKTSVVLISGHRYVSSERKMKLVNIS